MKKVKKVIKEAIMEVRYMLFTYTFFQFDMLSSIATSVDPSVSAYVIVGAIVIVILIIYNHNSCHHNLLLT